MWWYHAFLRRNLKYILCLPFDYLTRTSASVLAEHGVIPPSFASTWRRFGGVIHTYELSVYGRKYPEKWMAVSCLVLNGQVRGIAGTYAERLLTPDYAHDSLYSNKKTGYYDFG